MYLRKFSRIYYNIKDSNNSWKICLGPLYSNFAAEKLNVEPKY